MLLGKNETDFYELKSVAIDRLSPDAIQGFFWSTLLVSGFMTGMASLVINEGLLDIMYPIMEGLLNVYYVLFIIHLLIAIFFSFKKVAFQFQRLQAVLLCLVAIKLSMDSYLPFVALWADRNAPSFVLNAGALLLIGGILFLVISTIRGMKRVQKGAFRKGGKRLYDFQQSKGYVSLPIIFGATIFGGVIIRIASNMSGTPARMFELFFFLLIAAIIQYAISLAWPEFFLLAYCKFKFAGFLVEMDVEKVVKQKGAAKNALLYWYKKPFSILKSITSSVKKEEKPPIWTILLSWIHFSLYFILFFVLSFIVGLVRGKVVLGDAQEFLFPLFGPSILLGLILMIVLLVVFKIIHSVSRKS